MENATDGRAGGDKRHCPCAMVRIREMLGKDSDGRDVDQASGDSDAKTLREENLVEVAWLCEREHEQAEHKEKRSGDEQVIEVAFVEQSAREDAKRHEQKELNAPDPAKPSIRPTDGWMMVGT